MLGALRSTFSEMQRGEVGGGLQAYGPLESSSSKTRGGCLVGLITIDP